MILIGMTTIAVRSRFTSEVRRTVNRLAATIRYLYGQAAAGAKPYRLAFDIEAGTYWIEMAAGNVLIPPPESALRLARREGSERPKNEERRTKNEEREANRTAEEKKPEEKAPAFRSPLATTFGPAPNLPRELAKPVALPGKVKIKDLLTEQAAEPIASGTAYIHFFPDGYVEPAIINFSNPDESQFVAVEINPFTGFVKVSKEYRERK